MRGLGLMLLGCCAVACAAPPRAGGDKEAEPELEAEALEPALDPIEAVTIEVDGDDPLLAQARARVRAGRVPDGVRRELLASTDPDHRHAARLLQAIAGEAPASVLARTGAPTGAVELAATDELFEPEGEPAPAPEPALAPTPAPEPALAPADEPIERAPKLSSLPIGSPAWQWFATGLVILEPIPEPDEQLEIDPHIELETLVGPLPLLLRERPPMPAAQLPTKGDGPRLVILTSLSLRAGGGTSASTNEATLELAGAGAARLSAQPLTTGRVRLTVLDAGAVPSFLTARPSAPGLAVVDVARRDRTLEIEVELAPGWALQSVTSLENGARVQFAPLNVRP